MFQSIAAPECQDKPLQPQNSILMFFFSFRKKQNLVGLWMNMFDMTESTCCWHGARRSTAPDGLVETDVTERTLASKIPDFRGGRAKFRNS